jgi:hypothetical protein
MSATYSLNFSASRPFRAASLRQVVQYRLTALRQAIWHRMEALATVRAQQHLRTLATCYETQLPALAAELRQMSGGVR